MSRHVSAGSGVVFLPEETHRCILPSTECPPMGFPLGSRFVCAFCKDEYILSAPDTPMKEWKWVQTSSSASRTISPDLSCGQAWGGGDTIHTCILRKGHKGQCQW